MDKAPFAHVVLLGLLDQRGRQRLFRRLGDLDRPRIPDPRVLRHVAAAKARTTTTQLGGLLSNTRAWGVNRGSRPQRGRDPYEAGRAAMLAALGQAIPNARSSGRPVVIRPAPDLSLADAKELLPLHTGAMVLPLEAPLELRTIENIRQLVVDGARLGTYPPLVLITHADTGLLDVVLGEAVPVIELPRGLSPSEIDWP